MKGGNRPIHAQRWYPQDYHVDEHVRLLKARRDYLTLTFYRHFIDAAWLAGGDLPADLESLAVMVEMPARDVQKALIFCVGRLIDEQDGRLVQRRVKRDFVKALQLSEHLQEHGKRGAAKRWDGLAIANPIATPVASLVANPVASLMAKPFPFPTKPFPFPEKPFPDGIATPSADEAARVAGRLTRIVNSVLKRKLGRNRALEQAVQKAFAAQYTEDDVLRALWGGLCGSEAWWRGDGGADLMLLLRFQGGTNPTTLRPARQWLPEMHARFPEVYPQFIKEACEALKRDGLEAEVAWLQQLEVKGSS
jgi:hypothetical protein